MEVIFSHSFMQGNEHTGFSSLTGISQEKIIANMQEITGLVSHVGCKDHPYVIVPIITARVGGAMHNTFFVCCSECKDILIRALQYGQAHFQVICLLQKKAPVMT